MTADKRNTSIVVALILSMTVGAQVLLWLEPGTPRWQGDVSLIAERAIPIQEVEVVYVRPDMSDDAVLVPDDGRSLCVVSAEGQPAWSAGDPRVRLAVVGSEADRLSNEQKRTLLWALQNMSRASGRDLVPVRLAVDSDVRHNEALPVQAADLCDFLLRKQIIE